MTTSAPVYTDRNLAALRVRLAALILSVFPTWTDTERSNFGNILLDMFAFISDIQGYYLDSNALEAFITTAVQRRSLLKHSALVGYKPKGAAAASTAETFTATGLAANLLIQKGTIVQTLSNPDPVQFQTLSDLLLTPGAPTGTVEVENSTSQAESFVATGLPDATIQLSKTPYLDGSLSLTTPQGLFTEVSSFVNSAPTDKVFVVKVDNNDSATVYFGDGVTAGLVPTGTISCSYKTGGGASGNVAAHSIQAIPTTLQDIHGTSVLVTCDNNAGATGGADREGAEAIRQNAPQSITAPVTSVARTDFEIHSRQVPGVDRALYLTQNESGDVPINTGNLYIVAPGASGPDFPSDELLGRVRQVFVGDGAPRPMPATQTLVVAGATFLDVDVFARIYLKRNRTLLSDATYRAGIASAVRAALAAFFATKVTNADGTVSDNPDIDFGFYLREESAADVPTVGILAESDVERTIAKVTGVREVGPRTGDLLIAATRRQADGSSVVTQSAARQDVVVGLADFPRLGTVTLIDGDTGLAL